MYATRERENINTSFLYLKIYTGTHFNQHDGKLLVKLIRAMLETYILLPHSYEPFMGRLTEKQAHVQVVPRTI